MKQPKRPQMSYRKGRLASPKVEKSIPSAQPFNLKVKKDEQSE
jgi:hypothetical protein